VLSLREWQIRITALFRGQPRQSAEFRELVERACEWTNGRQATLKRQFNIGEYERYDWYQERGIIIFSTAGNPQVVANIQFVGSLSNRTQTWLWAWANSTLDEQLTLHSRQVQQTGKERGFDKLTTAKWRADEADGWEMTSVQAMLTTAQGVYRSPKSSGSSFVTLQNVRRAADDEWYEPAPDAR